MNLNKLRLGILFVFVGSLVCGCSGSGTASQSEIDQTASKMAADSKGQPSAPMNRGVAGGAAPPVRGAMPATGTPGMPGFPKKN